MSRDVIRIGILGFGNVGAGAYQVLAENADAIALKVGSRLEVTGVADVDWQRPRAVEVPADKRTTDARALISDPAIDIIVETIGGTEPARDFVLSALRAGKCVVTSNKELIAKHGREILEQADARSLDIYFEGAVGGGIPIIQPLKQALAANRIHSIIGIVNGTTNYILTRMADGDQDFAHALAEAQQRGYAEPDPTDDIEGNDAAYKLAILASIAFNSRAALDHIYREGISRIAPADMLYARELGYVVKLLAIGRDRGDALELRVHPAFLPQTHPLAAVSDVFNAIFVEGSAVGRLMFYGRGAGARPTGSAVVGDIIDIARNLNRGATGRVSCTCFEERPLRPMDEVVTKHYVRMTVADRPGVLAKIATVFGEEGVSLASVVQKGAPADSAEIVWVTHESVERAVRRSLERIRALPEVVEVCNWVRVEQG
jgi:homoserine dehydrogenase